MSSDEKSQSSFDGGDFAALIERLTDPTGEEVLKAVCDLRDRLVSLSQHDRKLSDRWWASMTLAEVLGFLERVYRHPDLSTPLVKLQDSLLDLERGVVAPMLQVERRSNLDPIGRDPLGRVRVKAISAAIMSRLMQALTPKEAAARLVAQCLRRARVTVGDRRTKEPWRTVAAWRDQAIKSKSENGLLGKLYEDWTKRLPPLPSKSREYERYREDLLGILAFAARHDA
jgi:hypothetical protein